MSLCEGKERVKIFKVSPVVKPIQQIVTNEKFPSSFVPLFQNESKYKNEFDLHENEPVRGNTFSQEQFRIKTRFDTEAKG